ncbi:MAG: hypothetical protein WBM59_02835, partial [Sedimenticolaceae bacterium]
GVPGSGERAFESLQFVIESGVAHEVRVTVHDALLPEPRLRQLLALLDEAGTADVVLQRCRTEQVFDPSLGQNSSAWDHRPRCSVDTWQPSAPGADSG